MRLIVLAENFGLNFSGGCIATAKFLETMQNAFDEVIILAQKVGIHHLDRALFVQYDELNELPKLLHKHNSSNTVGYGDFYVAEHFIKASIPFYFTYHDNFPDIVTHNIFDDFFIEDRLNCYRNIFENAVLVFSVSQAKLNYLRQYTSKVILVRNGVFQRIEKQRVNVPLANEPINILMAGNVDKRKYEKAVELFKLLNEKKNINFKIDIYGLNNDERLANEIEAFEFVALKGYTKSIPFKNYHLYLNTSLAENLSIAVVDAIANFTPVVTFDVGGLKEVINKNNGFVIQTFDIEAMVNQLIDVDYNYFVNYFDTTTIENFDWKKSANQMLDKMLFDM